ncbi:hypothetical protein [Halorarum halobium]|uniref:hypothetical protein n=1 Tax=Halorarum halobium TaxID=3075121 RepID=UPI0028AC258F|nr:hypothetical protein [Halobaculum sp. XH14]
MNGSLATLFLLASLLSPGVVGRRPDVVGRAGAATVGTVTIAYGGREVLRGLGGGYYCCSQGFYAAVGVVLVLAGWVALLPALGVVEPPGPPSESSEPGDVDGSSGPDGSADADGSIDPDESDARSGRPDGPETP